MAFPQLPWWSTPSCHSHLYPPAPPKTPRHVQLGQSCIQLIGRGSWILRWVTNYPHSPLPMRKDKHSTALLWWSLPASPAEFLKMVSVSLGRGSCISKYVCRVCSRACGGQIRSSVSFVNFHLIFWNWVSQFLEIWKCTLSKPTPYAKVIYPLWHLGSMCILGTKLRALRLCSRHYSNRLISHVPISIRHPFMPTHLSLCLIVLDISMCSIRTSSPCPSSLKSARHCRSLTTGH